MRKLIPITLILAFFSPWLSPLAFSSTPGVMICSTSVHKCTHGESCPMHGKKAGEASHNESHAAHSVKIDDHSAHHGHSQEGHAGHSVKSDDDNDKKHGSHYCGSFLRCADEDRQIASWSSIEIAFIRTGPIDIKESADRLTIVSDGRYSFTASARIDRPPAFLIS